MHKLRQMPSLAFFSLHRYGASKLYAFADDIASDCQHLSLLYLDRDIWNVDRSESEIRLLPWSIRRKVLKIKEYFGNEDAEWLLRHGEFPVSWFCLWPPPTDRLRHDIGILPATLDNNANYRSSDESPDAYRIPKKREGSMLIFILWFR